MSRRRETESAQRSDTDESMSRIAYLALREMVRSGSIPSGAMLSEQRLADEIGVGRTPVREAISRLDHEGLLERLPKRGVRVRTLDFDEIRDLYELREWLEIMAVRRAVESMTDDEIEGLNDLLAQASDAVERGCSWAEYRTWDAAFHSAIWRATANRRYMALLQSMHDAAILDPIFQFGLDMPAQGRVSLAEHAAIVTAIGERDIEAAESAVVAHTQSYRSMIAERIEGRRRRLDF